MENKAIEERNRGNKMLQRLERDLKCNKKVIMQSHRLRQRTGYGYLSVQIESRFKHLLPGCEKEVDK